ncbi:hypothetical protein CPLU01_05255 [Colletotrichum plurivorum]|uniref:Uncharacterized protein n=1 Tax=Colletotrichum plurivorum TaxID=2175906 RepID=A0A8H6NIK7_9PEZI|nr:hypothetical protein CPLU01_05255 [Colletotrichum plurivorum]
MTEPENFEEDLFADLYDDDGPAKPAVAEPAAAPAPAPAAAPAPVQGYETHAEPPPQAEPDHGGDEMRYDDEEDDDEVDFNLGGGSSNAGTVAPHAPPPNGTGAVKHEEPTYSTSTAKNPSAKEDG